MNYREQALTKIAMERTNQLNKWGHQRHAPEKWLSIAMEEVGEMCQAMQKDDKQAKKSDADDLLTETIQATAVLTAFIEQLLEERSPVCEGCKDPEFCRSLGCDNDGKGKDKVAVE